MVRILTLILRLNSFAADFHADKKNIQAFLANIYLPTLKR